MLKLMSTQSVMDYILHGFLSIVVSILLIPGHVNAECSKFSSVPTLQKATTVEGKCIYGFLNNAPFSVAQDLCTSEGTQLVTLQEKEKQELVWIAMGSQFGQHWMGLEKVDGVWNWLEGGTHVAVTSTRWESESSQSTMVVSYTMSSNDRWLWKMAEKNYRYATVCEDIQDTNPILTSPWPDSFSTASDSNLDCLFRRTPELTNVAIFKQETSINTHCAMHCLMHLECRYFRRLFTKTTDNCILMRELLGSGSTFACNQELCYKRC